MTTIGRDTNPTSPTSALPILSLLTGSLVISRAIYVIAKLRIPDLLADGPKTGDELARATSSHAPSLRRILRFLTALSVFSKTEPDIFELTPVGERFRTGVPGSLHDMILMTDAVGGLRPYEHLLDAVLSGEAAFGFAHGVGIFEFLASRPQESVAFNAAMAERTAALAPTVATTYDFQNMKTVVDIGGSQGTMLSAVLGAYPKARGILFDLPNVVAGAEARLAASGVIDRCEIRKGNFFESVPGNGDCYLLANIIHDWDDERSAAILRNCRRAVSSHATILVIERAVSDDNAKSLPTLVADISMMVLTGGQERTDAEYAKLFEQAGLKLTRMIPVLPPYAIFEGTRS